MLGCRCWSYSPSCGCHQHLFFIFSGFSLTYFLSPTCWTCIWIPFVFKQYMENESRIPCPCKRVNFVQTKLHYKWKFSTRSSCSLVFSEKHSPLPRPSVTLQLFLRGSGNNCRFLLTQQFKNSKAFSSLIFCNYSFWSSLIPCLRAAPSGSRHVCPCGVTRMSWKHNSESLFCGFVRFGL